MLETSPTDSIIIEEDDLREVAEAYNDSPMEFERDSNEFPTTPERDLNDIQTTSERDLDETPTTIERESDNILAILKRKAQTAAASLAHTYMEVETPAKLLKKHKDLVNLLDDHKFIEAHSPYGRRGNPNYYSVPPTVVSAVNEKLGTDYKAGFVAKVWLSMKYQKRFSPIFVKFLCVIWLCSLILLGWWLGTPAADNAKQLSATASGTFDLKTEVRQWETQNRYYFSGWRLQNEIAKCGIRDRGRLAEYLKSQSATQGASFTEPQKW